MAIKTIENVEFKSTTRIYIQRHFHKSTPYSQVSSEAPSNSNAPVLDKSDTRKITTYDDIMEPTP